MKVKVCGITREEDARLACALGAWAVGLILVPSSPRAVTVERAAALRRAVAPGVQAVGVLQDPSEDALRAAVETCGFDAVQLHGNESPEFCSRIRIPVYKTVTLTAAGELALLGVYQVSAFLFETARRLPGGRERLSEGEREARWRLAREARRYGSVFLAGELDAGNLARAVEAARPDAVDVCGGVEAEPGVKDPARLRAFFAAAAVL